MYDLLNAGNSEFEELRKLTLKRFELKPRICDNFDFCRAQVTTFEPELFNINQR